MRSLKLAALYLFIIAAIGIGWQIARDGVELPSARAQTLMGASGDFGGGSGGASFALDGTVQCASAGSGTSINLPAFTTSNTNDIVYVAVTTNHGPVTSVSDGSSLTWASRTSSNSSGTVYADLWSAKASSALSSDVVTVGITASSYKAACVFAFSGAHFAAPYDANVAMPNGANNPSTCVFTTSNANDILVLASQISSASATAAPSGFTAIQGTSGATPNGLFLASAYESVSSTQSGLTGGFTGAANTSSLCDAIIKGP